MAQYKRLPKAKAKKPDEFISAVDQLVHFAYRYKIQIVLSLIILLVIWGGTLVRNYYENERTVKINQELFEAQTKDTPDEYKKILEKYPNNPVSEIARVYLIDAYIKKGEKDQALEELNRAKEEIPQFLKTEIRLSEIHLLWDQGKLDQAYQLADKLASEDQKVVGDYPRFLKAELLEAMGKANEAKSIYQSLSEASQASGFVQKMAKERLLLLKI